jgi:N-methylhydantoinase A
LSPDEQPIHIRLGVDIGGTFTDLVLLESTGRSDFAKVSSTPAAPEQAVLTGIVELLSNNGASGASVDEVVHGTTVGSNALLQRAGSPTGLITTRGFRDVLEIGRLRTPGMFELDWDKPAPLVRRRHRLEVEERVAADGKVLVPLDEEGLLRAARTLIKEGVTSVAICFINSYLTATHERRAGELLRDAHPDLAVSLSVDVLPEAREYERSSTVVVNAYVARVLGQYLSRLEAGLRDMGIHAPLRVANSNGALAAVSTARVKPVFFISSGRAAGVAGAAHLGRTMGRRNLIVFDMGGTTASAALVHNGELSRLQEYEFRDGISTPSRFIKAGGYLMRVPTVDVAEVGSGAGSIAHLDPGGLLKVGPVSAGALPGPACYGAGGLEPTVTDANLLLGYLPAALAGGTLVLDQVGAERAIRSRVAEPLGLDTLAAATGIRRIVNGNMARVIRAVTVERGVDPRDFSLLAFGGSGPLHACDLADDAGIEEVIFPPMPGVFTATGMLAGDIERYFIRALPGLLDDLNLEQLERHRAALRLDAELALREEGVDIDRATFDFQIDLRFIGQDSQIPIDLDAQLAGNTDVGLAGVLRARFIAAYEAIYRYASADKVEVVNIRLVAGAARATRLDFAALRMRSSIEPQGIGRRQLHVASDGAPVDAPVLTRNQIGGGVTGPAIVESPDCTIFIPPGWRAKTDEFQNIVGRRA